MLSVWGLYSFYSLQLELLSLPLFVAGGLVLLFGFKALHALAFPIFLLIFLAPVPSELLTALGSNLIVFTANASYSILSFFRFPVQLSNGADIVLTVFTNDGRAVPLSVGVQCSGLYSLLGFVFFVMIFAYLASGSLLKKIVFSSMGLVFIYSLNILRVCLIAIVAYVSGMSEALDLFHFYSGIIILFVGVLLWLFMGEKLFKISVLQRLENAAHAALPKRKLNWKRLVIIFLSLSILAFLISQSLMLNYSTVKSVSGFDFDSSTGEVKGIFPYNVSWTYEFEYRDTVSQDQLGLIDVADYSFFNNKSAASAILEVSDAQSKFHTWDACLHYQGFQIDIENETYTTVYEDANNLIIGEIFVLNIPDLNQSAVLLYWFDALPFNMTGKIEVLDVKLTLIEYFPGAYNATTTNIVTDADVDEVTLMAKEIAGFWSSFRTPPQVLITDLYNNKEAITAILGTALIFSLGTWGVKIRHDGRNSKSDYEGRQDRNSEYVYP
jgi:exosortase